MATLETALLVGYLFGIASFFSPCAVGMVPAYLGYFLRAKQDAAVSHRRRILDGAFLGIVTTSGFVALFGLIALLLGFVDTGLRSALGGSFFWLAIGMGAALIVLGLVTVLDVPVPFNLPIKAPARRNIVGFFGFGVAYGLVSVSCNLPLFLSAVFTALALGGGPGAAAAVLAFALGKGTMMILASLLVAVPKESIDAKRLVRLAPRIKRLSGIALIVGGAVMVAYYGYIGWSVRAALGG
jgi:cytochrome c biogenesis protein CcdA